MHRGVALLLRRFHARPLVAALQLQIRATMPPRKAAKKVDEDDDLSAEDLGSDASDFEEERRRKPAKKRASKAGESKARGTLTEGWEAVPDCLILVHKDPEMPPADKVAAFDFDATLVTTKSGRSSRALWRRAMPSSSSPTRDPSRRPSQAR